MPVTFVSHGARPWQAVPSNTYVMYNEDPYSAKDWPQYKLDVEDDEVYSLRGGAISGKLGGTEDNRDTWDFAFEDQSVGVLDYVDLTFKLNFDQLLPGETYELKLEYMPFGASAFHEVRSVMTHSRSPGDQRPEAELHWDADPGFYKLILEDTDNVSALGQHSYALDMLIS